jgi:hypothetical protein
VIERIAIAALVGAFGFLIGLFAWWTLTLVPELRFGWRFYLGASLGLGVVAFLVGLWRPHATIDALGVAGQKIWSLGSEVLHWFWFLRR